MTSFYTSCLIRGNDILYRGVENSKRISTKIRYKPKLFVPTKSESSIKTIDNQSVDKIQFESIRDANDFVDRYKDVENFEIFGNTGYNYVYLSDLFPNEVEFDLSKIVIGIIDIEVDSSDGFPDPVKAQRPILSIALKLKYNNSDKIFVFGLKNFDVGDSNVVYAKCDCEQSLLEKFIKVWSSVYPDVVTGWNSETFDWLYIVNRLNIFYPRIGANKLSKWGVVYVRQSKNIDGTIRYVPEILGTSILDYLSLYRKFTFVNQESYRLDYICHVELGERKLNYDEYSNLNELYDKNPQKFLEYNIRDVQLVDMLETKLNLLSQSIQIAYDTKVNFSDVFMQVRMWDCIIYDYFRKNNLAYPFKKKNEKYDYAGAYVKDPIVGSHKWVVSMDVNSMYPNLIVQYNISPDTITGKYVPIDVSKLVNSEYDLSHLHDEDCSMTANGQHFTRSKQGFLPIIIERMYADRVRYKKLMIEKQKELELIEAELERRSCGR